MSTRTNTVEVWHGCFDDSWRDIITPDAFAHPAKFSRGLIERIITHGLSVAWFHPGDIIGDPFGGIGTGGIISAYHGLAWKGVELEPRFCRLAKQNFDLHFARWNVLGAPLPELFQGDSRKFASIIGAAAAVVTSPPYADTEVASACKSQNPDGRQATYRRAHGFNGYAEQTDGNIGSLKSGYLSAVVTSPPYVDSIKGEGEDIEKTRDRMRKRGDDELSIRKVSKHGNDACSNYGSTEGNLGNVGGETYWQAMAQVYAQCFIAIRPGGIACINVKDYVKDKARVPLCEQTLTLLQHVGFDPLTRIHAMLVKEHRTHTLFAGEQVHRKERKSFFRRLAEKNGSPRIDHEEVLVVRKPSLFPPAAPAGRSHE